METKIEKTSDGKNKVTFILNKEDMKKRREKLAKLHAEEARKRKSENS